MTTILIGVDEAGRWSWAGPVVAAAFVIWKNRFKKSNTYHEINDSKMLNKWRRAKLFESLQQASVNGEVLFAVTAISSEIIDTKGIKEANRIAMELSIKKILDSIGANTEAKIEIHIDGNDHYQFDFSDQKNNTSLKVMEHIRGDQLFKIIGAASILAKVTRDNWMDEYGKLHPEYSFERHKGYGTRTHQVALESFGVLDIHRKSYSPIKHLILRAKKI